MNIEPGQIPRKSHLKLKEVSDITGVKPYVLRFWETEFEEISPITASNGQKIYEYDDIETILKIKRLLFDEKLSIKEAQHRLRSKMNSAHDLPHTPIEQLERVADGVEAMAEQRSAVIETEVNEEHPLPTFPVFQENSDLIGLSEQDLETLERTKTLLGAMLQEFSQLKQMKGWVRPIHS